MHSCRLVSLPRAVLLALVFAGVPFLVTPGALAQEPPAADEDDDAPENENLPLPVDRTVSIDMTEGSWISLDVSPDGETIVFDFLGDLFTIPFEGGTATQLTSGMAFDAQPRFSPDGTRIVYTSDYDGGQNVWIMSLDGSDTVQVSRGASNRTESPEWMPDGTTWSRRSATSGAETCPSSRCSTWAGAAASNSSRSPTT